MDSSFKALRVALPLSLIVLASCGGGGGSDATAPTVSSTSPAASATSVATNSVVTATFSEAMFASTIDSSSFSLASTGNNTGAVSYDANTNIATFTPSSNLGMLTSYTATLSSSITDLAGNALTTYSLPFTTADGTWGTAALIETDTTDAYDPQVAFDSSGNATVVWSLYGNIWANHFIDNSWGTATQITTPGFANNPQVAVDSSDNAIAVWHRTDDTSIWSSRYNGSSWSSPVLIEAGSGAADSPLIAVDGSGNAISVWRQSDGSVYNIWANHFNGTSWGTAELIEAGVGDTDKLQVAIDSSGNAIAVWSQFIGAELSILTNRFNGTSWGTTPTVIESNTGLAVSPQISFDKNDNALVVWHQRDVNGIYNIWANRFNGTSWGTAEPIETETANDAYNPQIAFDDMGIAFAVWEQSDGTNRSIWVNHYNGTSWSTAVLIETEVGNATNPQVAVDSSGKALVVWKQHDGSYERIWANRFNGTSWGTAALIESNIGNAYYSPQVAVDNSGKAIAVWSQYSGTNPSIWANRFE